jgi:hypothetical protein
VSYLRENDRLLRRLRRHLGQVVCPHILACTPKKTRSPARTICVCWQLDYHPRRLSEVTGRNSFHMISIDNDRQQVVRETVDFVRSLPASPPVPRSELPAASNMTPDIDQTIAQILVDKFHIEAERVARGPRRPGPGLAGPDGIRLRHRRRLQLRIPEERLDPRQGGITLQHLAGVIREHLGASPKPAGA